MNLRGAGWRLAGTNVPPDIVWPRQGWASTNAAMDRMFEIFPDKYPILLKESGDAWTFGLGWPRHVLEPIDLALPERARTCYGLELAQLSDYFEVRRCGRADFVFSMFHSRALLAPALAGARRGGKPIRRIVHVDAHHDLASTLLTTSSTATLANSYFGIECRLNAPETVTQTIDCGFIHKGSFLTAFCLGATPGCLYHVCQGASPARFWLHPAINPVRIGQVICPCSSLIFENAPLVTAWEISESAALPEHLPMEDADGIWLDVDLDAFCNRFDGNSDHCGRPKLVEEVDEMQLGIITFLESLSNAAWLPNIEAVSVAASPGFFPSELWELAIPTVCEGIAKTLSA